ncbi:GDP-mannose 6-dehydrogenase [compost metagenome]
MSSLLRSDLQQVVADADVIVLGNSDELFETVVQNLPAGKKLIDLVGFMRHCSDDVKEGLCW